ncbi:MAG: extracellular solute-binding protein [Isosphaeraceae bacterium]|nr:extracellular solute-binding protein [Isosphaeraceae bacterium]
MTTLERFSRIRRATIGLCLALASGCGDGPSKRPERVVVYTALDREFSEPILEEYAAANGIDIDVKYDTESTKTVGLTRLIMAEAGSPRCDLFWNNEILNTIRLDGLGLLQPWTPASADAFPERFKSPSKTWYGFAARARVILVNTELLPEAERPRSIFDLVKPRLRGRVAIAKPLFGTTATHAVCLFQRLGEERAAGFFRDLKANDVRVLSGNKQVATAVGSGEVAAGLTDTDDAIIEVEAGRPVAIIYPDRAPGEIGTLFLPNTLALIKGSPRSDAARKLADHLLSAAIEERLARGPSAQIPLHREARPNSRVETPATVEAMEVDFPAAVGLWDRVAAHLASEFGG